MLKASGAKFESILRFFGAVVLVFAMLASVPAHAQLTCTDLFGDYRPSANEVLVQLDDAVKSRLLSGRTLEDVNAQLGLLRKWQLARLKKRLDLAHLKVEGDYSDIVASLHLIFIEPRLQPLDIFRFLSKGDQQRRFNAWVDRQILESGLRGLLADPRIGDPLYKTLIGRSLARVKAKLARVPKLPFRLPRVGAIYHDRTIPHDVLVRVLENGIEAERPTLETLHGRQQNRDLMRALRPYVGLVGFVAMGLSSQFATDKMVEYQAAKNTARLEQELASTEQGLDELIAVLKEQNAQNASAHRPPAN